MKKVTMSAAYLLLPLGLVMIASLFGQSVEQDVREEDGQKVITSERLQQIIQRLKERRKIKLDVDPRGFSGQVRSSGTGPPVEGAIVYLVPTDRIDMTRITGSSVFGNPKEKTFPAENHDEPLEDTIDKYGQKLPNATTDASGAFLFSKDKIDKDKRYFVHVTPTDEIHLPGGDLSRKSYTGEELLKMAPIISVSSMPPTEAFYIGTSRCLSCHDKKMHKDWHYNQTGHKLAWTIPGKKSPRPDGRGQDFGKFPNWFKSDVYWPLVDAYAEGTKLEIGDYDPAKKGSTKFRIRKASDERTPIERIYANIYLWKSKPHSRYYITVVNKLNANDPPQHLPIEMVYGGGVHRQRFIVSVPKALGERQGHYTLLQYNPDGNDSRLNPDRREWRDYKFSHWWSIGQDKLPGTEDDLLRAPLVNENTIEAECAGCHVTGAERYKDSRTGQILVRGVDDPHGAFNLDDDPSPDEVNVGCESCHGAGSRHAKVLDFETSLQYMVNPAYLAAERSDVICGRCHDRRLGHAVEDFAKTQAVRKIAEGKYEFLEPGERRHTLLTKFSSVDGKGPKPGTAARPDLWPDDLHSRSPRQQYAEHLKSAHYKNDRWLVSCADCHDSHGKEGTFSSWLKGNPNDPKSSLCQECHAPSKEEKFDILTHMEKYLHTRFTGLPANCVDCHMVGTSRPGGDAGHFGLFAKQPPFANEDEEADSAYWQGHLNSHVFDVPKKTNPGVLGVRPVDAMPVPYTARCGTCHNVGSLQYWSPGDAISIREFYEEHGLPGEGQSESKEVEE